jgi:hypothetical protein
MSGKLQGNTIVLAAPNPADPFIGTLVLHFQNQWWHVAVAATPEAVRGMAASGDVVMVVFDSGFPKTDETIAAIRSKPGPGGVALVRLMGSRAAAEPVRFRFLADRVLNEPCEVADIIETATAAQAEAARRGKSRVWLTSFMFSAEGRWADEAYETAARLVAQTGLADEAQIKLVTAFREAVAASTRPAGRAGSAAVIRVSLSAGPREVAFTVAGEPGRAIWPAGGAAGAAGSIATAAEAQATSVAPALSLIRKCSDGVSISAAGDAITFMRQLA